MSACVCAGANDELTEMKTRSASLMAESMSVEKNKFLPLHDSTTSLRPGWGGGGQAGGGGGKDKEGVSVDVKNTQGKINDMSSK